MNELQKKEKAINQTIERFTQLKKEGNTKIPCGFCGNVIPCYYCIRENIWNKEKQMNACLDFISNGKKVPYDWNDFVILDVAQVNTRNHNQKILNAVCDRVINRMKYLKRKMRKERK